MMSVALLVVLAAKLLLLSGCHCQEMCRKTISVNSESCKGKRCEVNGMCCDLQQALEKVEDYVEIVIQTNTNLSSFVYVCHKTGLLIHGANAHEPFQVSCSRNSSAGLGFFHVTNLSLSNLIIANCGGVTNFSSCSQHSPTPKSQVAAVYIKGCSDISVSNVTITNTSGTGMFMEKLHGLLTFHHAIFSSNHPNEKEQAKLPWTGGGMTVLMTNPMTSLHIKDCMFMDNHIVDASTNVEGDDRDEYTQVDEGHGGGLYVDINKSECNATISGTNFVHNTAPYGGGISIILHEKVNNTNIKLSDCYFRNNSADGSIMSNGGGMQLGFSVGKGGQNNVVVVERAHYLYNYALLGGGLSVYSTGLTDHSRNRLHFIDCVWTANLASSGAAVDLSVKFHENEKGSVFILPHFTNCTFDKNLIILPVNYTSLGSGAFFTMVVDAMFEGTVVFSSNIGSAITAIDSVIHFNTTLANFTRNIGLNGGAVSLLSFAYVKLYPGSELKFVSNKAMGYGGAIYSQVIADHQLLVSSTCAIQYSSNESFISPDDWDAQITFENNFVQNPLKANSIYVSSLQPCQIAYSQYKHFIVKKNFVFSFCPFKFTSGNWTEETETAAAQFVPSSLNISMSPGISRKLNITAYDDLNRTMNNAIFEVYLIKENVDIVKDEVFVTGNNLALKGVFGNETKIVLQSIDLPVLNVKMNVSFVVCPPAYSYNHDTLACECNKQAYFGISECISPNGSTTSNILNGVWAGYLPNETAPGNFSFVTSTCLFGMCDLNNKNKKVLPIVTVNNSTCDSVFAEVVCAGNRVGMHCSSCKNGTSVFYHSNCYPCHDSQACSLGWLYFILSDLLPLTFVFVAIALSGMKITSGWVQGLILFSHLVSTISVTANGSIHMPEQMFYPSSIFWGATYGLINMKFLYVPELSFCLYESASPIELISIRYTITAYALILVFLVSAFIKYCIPRYECLSQRVRYTTALTSIVNGLSALLVLSFTNCLETSFQILHPTAILGEDLVVVEKQATFMENRPYMQGRHLLFAIPAIAILIMMMIPPTLLLLYPIFNMISTAMGIEELKVTHTLSNLFGYSQLKPFYDLFYHSFKDNCRFFAGLYLFYRVFIQLAFFVQTTIHLYYTIELVLIIYLAIHTLVQPYANHHHNRIDGLLFSILLVVNGMTCFNLTVVYYMEDKDSQRDLEFFVYVQTILISLPMIVAIIYIVTAYIFLPCCRKYRGKEDFHYDHLPIRYGSMDERDAMDERDVSLQDTFSTDS